MSASKTRRLRSIWSDLAVRWQGITIIAIPLTCVLTSLVTFAWLQDSTESSQEYIDKTEKILYETNRLLSTVLDAETAIRGYDITKRPEYLTPYKKAIAYLPQSLISLRQLLKDNPRQRQQLQLLEAQVAQRIANFQHNLTVVDAQKQEYIQLPELKNLVNQGQLTTAVIRTSINTLQNEERGILKNRIEDLERQRNITNAILWLTGVVGVGGAIAAFYLFDRLDGALAQRALRLRDSNTRLQAILDNVVDGIITVNNQGHIKSFNQAAQKMFGYEATEVIGKSLKLLVKDAATNNSIETLDHFIGSNGNKLQISTESVGQRQDGTTFPIELVFSEMQLGSRHLYIGILRDIADRIQAEETLRKQAHLLDLANDAILVRDRSDRITFWNQGAERLYGYSKAEAVGKNVQTLLKTEFPQPIAEINAVLRLQGYWQGELIKVKQDGTRIPVASRWTLQVDEAGEPIATLQISNDITERKLTEEALQKRANELAHLSGILAQTNAALEKRNQELDRFAYVVSHDLKAPLRAINNLSTWLEEDLQDRLTEDTQHQMQLLRNRVHRMEALIDGVLQYSRVGRIKSEPETVNVESLLAEAIDSLAPPPEFTIVVEPGMPTFLAERLPLEQVFANTIGNAIKHHDKPNGCVKISARDLGDAYEFAVADDGPGIAPEYHEKIFGIFETLKSRDREENTGVGLAIVKKIIEDKGGTIYLKSQVGQGTTFYFTWRKNLAT